MSIGKRFVNLVRSNLNSVLDRAGRDFLPGRRGDHLEDLTDTELEEELRRRRARREAAERAAYNAGAEQAAWDEVEDAVREGSGRYRTTRTRSTGSYRRTSHSTGAGRRPTGAPPGARDLRLSQLYAQLECPYGADLTTVRKHYRALMRKYHPDMHAGSPDKQRLATDLSQRLTTAYNELRRALATPPG